MGRHSALDPEKRERLMRCALSLFADKGMSGISVEDITEAAGLAKGTFYLYFENRDALEKDLLERCIVLDLRHSMVGVDELSTYSDKLKRRVLNILRFSKTHPEESSLLRQVYLPVNLAGTENQPHSKSYGVNRDFIQKGIAAGEFRPLPLDLLCQLFFSGVEGLSTYTKNHPEALDNAALTDQALECLIRLLK
jgi:AcrR family transcriptional regulator